MKYVANSASFHVSYLATLDGRISTFQSTFQMVKIVKIRKQEKKKGKMRKSNTERKQKMKKESCKN